MTESTDSLELPLLVNGAYYSESNGMGVMGSEGDWISVDSTIYVYSNNGTCTAEDTFDIVITPLPVIDIVADEIACDSLQLPATLV